MSALARIAEARIEEAIARGELDDLPGAGRPLPPDPLRGVPAELRAGYRLLRGAGFAPEEVATRRELAELRGRIVRAGCDDELAALQRRRMALELKRDLAAERRLRR